MLLNSMNHLQAYCHNKFVDDYIIGLNVKHVVAGFDYSYGRLGKERWRLYHFMQEGSLHRL